MLIAHINEMAKIPSGFSPSGPRLPSESSPSGLSSITTLGAMRLRT